MTIYLAGALFTEAERAFLEGLAKKLEGKGHVVYAPHLQEEPKESRAKTIFERNVEELRACQAVVAVCEYQQIDDGTAWEIGYARGLGKPVYGLRTDGRTVNSFERVNLMIEQSLSGGLHAGVDDLIIALSSAVVA